MPNLDMYSGDWTTLQARHLLRRTTFGPSREMVNTSVEMGLSQTLDQLFAEQPLPDLPVNSHPDEGGVAYPDPYVNYGEPWFDRPIHPDDINDRSLQSRTLKARLRSLVGWTYLQMFYSGISLREKMALFWHNHFVVAGEIFAQRKYVYQTLFRTNAFGNFKQLTKDITIDTGMLKYLSGTINTKDAPNENYSRELLELFTIGKGEMVDPGDYTNYTETDVEQLARALTGWYIPKSRAGHDGLYAEYNRRKHDTGDKQLSHRFNNAVITDNGENEYKDVVDVIFQQDECSRFITRKLYRWFVYSEITSEIETNIIEPLAQIIRDNDYEVGPALRVLFASDHFFETTACMIKSPIDFIMSASRGLGVTPPAETIEEEYKYAVVLYVMATQLDQSIFCHPNVAGWKAYYQEPQFYKTWINSLLLPRRTNVANSMVYGEKYEIDDGIFFVSAVIPVLEIAESIVGAEYPEILVSELVAHLFNYPITDEQKAQLKSILTLGLMDDEWTEEYGYYLEDPTNKAKKSGVQTKLRTLFSTMVQMSEFQIM